MSFASDALFNPQYLPQQLLHRDQELEMLSNWILREDDSPSSFNVMVHGSFGVGRTTLLRFLSYHNLSILRQPFLNFHEKSSTEIVYDALHALDALVDVPDFSAPLHELWTLLKRVIRKSKIPIVFTFDDVNGSTTQVYEKFLKLCKELRIPSMATAPRYYPRQLSNHTAQLLDFSLELEPYTDQQFLDIIKQRVSAAFPISIPASMIEFMADIICLLDFQRPATAIELLQNLYPMLSQYSDLSAETIRDACLNSKTLHYDFWSEHFSSLAEFDAASVLLLQGIGQYFLGNPGRVYTTGNRLYSQYQQVCEAMGFYQSYTQFTKALNTLLFYDLLIRSRYNPDNYFTLLPAHGYLEIVELLLGELHEEC